MKKFAVLFAVALTGCASDPEFARKLELALRIANQSYNQPYSQQSYATPAAYQPPVQDYEWDWDQFIHNGQYRWACRGVQTGQFAPESNCQFKIQTDLRWPAKYL